MRRDGFTLAEMIVVLAVVASLLALTLPAMIAPLGKAELREAARQFRAELGQARLRAIESGAPQEFRYEPGGRRFIVSPRSGSTETEGRSPATPAGVSTGLRGAAAATAEPLPGELPDGVSFAGPEEPPTAGLVEAPPGEAPAGDPSREGWSPPIVFYPNGRSDNARVWLRGPKQFAIEVTLRGLTGTAAVGELTRPRPEEAGP